MSRYAGVAKVQMIPPHCMPPRAVRLGVEQALGFGRLDQDGETVHRVAPMYQVVIWSYELGRAVAMSDRDAVPLGPLASRAFRDWAAMVVPQLAAGFWSPADRLALVFDTEMAAPLLVTVEAAQLLLGRAGELRGIESREF